MYKQHVTVVAAGGGANLNYIIFSFIFIKLRGLVFSEILDKLCEKFRGEKKITIWWSR